MSELLYVKASPRRERSHSIAVADTFVEAYTRANPSHEIRVLDVFERDLPQFEGDMLQGKYNIMHGLEYTEEQRRRWSEVESLIEEFSSAEKYVFAVPMWNFHIPYRLKQYLDIVIQPTYVFAVTETGDYRGLLSGKAYVSYARGGLYAPGTPTEGYNHQAPYFEMILAFMGITVSCRTAVEGTVLDREAAAESRDRAMEEAEEMARSF
jgi:FMN-dependent NADH-azoreductase